MKDFDHDFVTEAVARLGGIEPDAKPAWGVLTRQGLYHHLADIVRFSMGKGGRMPDTSNWIMRRIVGPLTMNGVMRIPKNLKTPMATGAPPSVQDDLETLHAVLEEYLNLVQAGELNPRPHPAFGDIGVDGWAKMHVVHFEHHMRQFGVG